MAFASITTEQLKFLLDTCREMRSSQWFRNQQLKPRPDDIGLAYVKFRNDSGEVVPPRAAMMITGTTEIGGDTYVTIDKPDGPTDAILINNDYQVGIDRFGSGFKWGWVRVLADGGSAANTPYQTQSGQWELTPGPGPIVIYGRDYVADGVYAGRIVGTLSGADPEDLNPGVVTVEIDAESACAGESFDDLGYHVFLATITSRPFGSVEEMRKERSGELTIFDPTGCMLDAAYDPEDFIGATAFVSLMYGGEIFDEEYNFMDEATGESYVLPTDAYETFRPADSCKPFGWIGGERTGYTASIGPIVPNGITTFQVKLPERGVYRITITYGDATDATNNLLELFDGDQLLATMADESEDGETWVYGPEDFNFKSSNTPLLKVTLNNADGRDSRIVKLEILQVDPPTQWEVINRCCIARDTE